MASRKIGDRVGAICGKLPGDKLGFFGYGVYEGDVVPPPGVGMFTVDFNELNIPNPKITLDNGKTVWGCECHWGSEDKIKSDIERWGLEVVIVDPDEYRKGNGIG